MNASPLVVERRAVLLDRVLVAAFLEKRPAKFTGR